VDNGTEWEPKSCVVLSLKDHPKGRKPLLPPLHATSCFINTTILIHSLPQKLYQQEAQKLVDAREAKFQEEQRRRSIDRANRIMYEQTDKARQLQSALLLTQVMTEREDQIQRKQRKHLLEKEVDTMYINMMSDTMQKLADRENNEEKERRTKTVENMKSQQQQIAKVIETRKQKREEIRLEGIRRKEKMAQDIIEAELERKARDEERRKNNAEFLAFNEALQKKKAEEQRILAEEEAQLAAYALEKERKLQEQRDQAAAAFAERMKVRGQLMDVRAEQLRKMQTKESTLLNKQVAELDAKRLQREVDDKERVARRQKEIDASRAQQVARKKREAEERHRQEMDMVAEWKKKNAEFKEAEMKEKEESKKEAVRNMNFLKKQIETKVQNETEQYHMAINTIKFVEEQQEGAEKEKFEKYKKQLCYEYGVDDKAMPFQIMERKQRARRLAQF